MGTNYLPLRSGKNAPGRLCCPQRLQVWPQLGLALLLAVWAGFFRAPARADTGDAEAIASLLASDHPEEAQNETGINFSGWMDVQAQVYSDQRGAHSSVDVHHLYLIGDAKLGSVWRTFFELEFEHLPRLVATQLNATGAQTDGAVGKLNIDRAYLEARIWPELTIRAGKFNTPAGIRIPAHWTVLTPIIQKPIFEDNNYIPIKSVGLEAYGSRSFLAGKLHLNYSIFLSNGLEVEGTDRSLDGITGLGGNLQLRLWGKGRLGLSAYRQRNPTAGAREESSLLPFVELTLPLRLLFRGEYIHQWLNGDSPIDAWYLLLQYHVHKLEGLFVSVRIDGGIDQHRASGNHQRGYLLNISYKPTAATKLSIEGGRHEFPDSNQATTHSLTLWAGIIF